MKGTRSIQAREKKVDFQRRAHEEAKEKVREAQATREKEIATGKTQGCFS